MTEFAGLLAATQGAIGEAQERLAEFQLEQMRRCFKADGSPALERFSLAKGGYIEVSRMSLTPLTCLAIDEVELRYTFPASRKEAHGFRAAAGEKVSFFRRLLSALPGKREKRFIEVKAIFKDKGGMRS